jgi:hypothetical protein
MRVVRRTVLTICATLGLLAGTAALPLGAAADTAPTSTAPASGPAKFTGYPTLVDVRWGAHTGYDRVVFEFKGGTPAYRVAYGTLRGLGTGSTIALAGEADLVVDFETARAHDGSGRPTYPLTTKDPLLKTLRQVKWGGDYEGYVRAGLGLRDRVGFRVTTLTSPPRVVVDVAHRATYTVAPVSLSGSATNVVVDEVRGARHSGFDRLVFDVRGTAKPGVVVRYVPDSAVLLVKLSAVGSAPRASYGGPSPVTFGYPVLRSARLGEDTGGSLTFRVATTRRHGFRVIVLTSPTRVVVDVAH